jgi:uncharacterized membrane-anchored protein YitT (DUF2179 family)
MEQKKTRVQTAVCLITIPFVALLFNNLGQEIAPIFHRKACNFIENGGSIDTKLLHAYQAFRAIILFVGVISGIFVGITLGNIIIEKNSEQYRDS